jgi:excisionase family DNA binding protein
MTPSTKQPSKASRHFAGRVTLRVGEVATALRTTEQHILDLIEEGRLQAINVGGSTRNFWRIPVEAYEQFTAANSNLSGSPVKPKR